MVFQVLELDIRPVDVLRFRKPTPFTIGGYAPTYMYPPPQTISSAIITQLYLSNRITSFPSYEDMARELGDRLVFRGPYLSDENLTYVPAPLDLATCGKCGEVFLSKWKPVYQDLKTSWPIHECGSVGRRLTGYFIPSNMIVRRSEVRPEHVVGLDVGEGKGVVLKELRPGICLNEKVKSVLSGYFYQAEWISLREGYFFREYVISSDEELTKSIQNISSLRLGGGGRPAQVDVKVVDLESCYKSFFGVDINDVAEDIIKKQSFDLIFLTPAIFLDGTKCVSRPPPIGLSLGERLVGISIDKPVIISGWDLRLRGLKRLYHAAPAGSIYRYTLSEPIAQVNDIRDKVLRIFVKGVGHWNSVGCGSTAILPVLRGGVGENDE